ncbi:outer membrane beta-barrel protein [Nemorincola caseinilytica]
MKKYFFAAFVSLLLLQGVANGQVMGFREPIVNMGVKVGGSFMHLSSAPIRTSPGPLAGIYVWKNIGRFGVRLEALGTMVTHTTKYPASAYVIPTPGIDTETKASLQAIYLNVPLLLEYQLNENLQLLGGPQFGYLLSLTDKNDAYTKVYGNSEMLTKTDFAVVAGAEYALTRRKKLKAGARAVIGVTDVNNSTYYLVPRTWSSVALQLSLSYNIM